MKQTIVEKIAQPHMAEGPKPPAARRRLPLHPADHVMTHDNTSAVMKKFKAIGATRVHDRGAAGVHRRSRHSEHGRVEPGEVSQHGGVRARAGHRLLSAGHRHRPPDHGGEGLRAAGHVCRRLRFALQHVRRAGRDRHAGGAHRRGRNLGDGRVLVADSAHRSGGARRQACAGRRPAKT